MRRLLKNALILISPLIIWGVTVMLVDPYNYFSFSLVDDVHKEGAQELNTLMYRTVDYMKHPCENMLIGDSRTDALPIDLVEELTDKDWKKLNTNAAKLNEIFELFYMAYERKPIKNVIIGVNFNMFNEYGYANRVSGVKKVLDNPLMYLFNKDVTQSTYLTIKHMVTGEKVSSKPEMDKEAFWDWNINTIARRWYERYKFPEDLYKQLKRFDAFTSEHNVHVTFIIVPHHDAFRDRLHEFQLTEEELRFKTIMTELNADVYDYDFSNSITSEKANFADPVHSKREIGALILTEIFTDDVKIGRTKEEIVN